MITPILILAFVTFIFCALFLSHECPKKKNNTENQGDEGQDCWHSPSQTERIDTGIKQVIVVNRGLKMRRDQEANQVAHASMKVLLNQLRECSDEHMSAMHWYGFHFRVMEAFASWLKGSQIIQVAYCRNEQELFFLQAQADEAKLSNAAIQESFVKEECFLCHGKGRIFINHGDYFIKCGNCDGSGKIFRPAYAALAIGPDHAEKIDKITGRLGEAEKS